VRTRTEIRRLQRELGVTAVFVTHDQEEAMVLSDRIAVMRGGVLQQLGRPMDVYRDPLNLFVASFIGSPAMNILAADVQFEGDAVQAQVSGQRLSLPRTVTRTRWQGAQQALLGIRPTDLGVAPPEPSSLRGRVFLVEPVGPFAYVDIDLDGWTIKGTCNPDRAPMIGDVVGITFVPDRACLFDPQTEMRL
jgi:multiple sugar transport system ATP-binding protein